MNDPVQLDSTSQESLVAEIADEFIQRIGHGEQPDIEEYANRHPQIADVLRHVLPALELIRFPPADSEAGTDLPEERQGTRRLGDYRIVREVGRGGMGVVYEAEQVSLGRKVALKVLPFAAMLDQKQLQRFQNEARAAASLRHPNIVQVHFVGCERAVHFYAMDYIEGQDLAEMIHHLRRLEGSDAEVPEDAGKAVSELADSLTSGRFAPAKGSSDLEAPTAAYEHEQAPGVTVETKRTPQAAISTERSTKSPAYFRSIAEIGVQVAEALDHAHEHGVVHRDVKPSNVILDNSGKPWVTDFGLARVESNAALTVTGDLLGTVRYMSPEQALAKRIVVDHRTDVYSLGVTLYELLTLQPAFGGQDRQELLRQIAFEEPKAPRRLNKAIPEELEIIVTKAMAKDPAERYETAQELAEDLRRFLEDRPIRARRPTLVQRAAKWSRRHKPIVWSVAVSTFLLLVIGLVGLSIGNLIISTERDEKDAALTAETKALVEKNEALLSAKAERRRAEENLDLALAAMDAVYLDAIGRDKLLGEPVAQPEGAEQPELDEQPPLTDLERELLKRGLDFYDQFAQKNADAPRAFVQTGQAYYRVGLIQGGLGDMAAAGEAYRGAIERFERMTQEEPDNAEHFRRLGEAYRGFANVVPQWDAAKELLEKSRGAYSKAIELKPEDVAYYLKRGEISRALDDRKGVKDFEKALQLDPGNVGALLNCAYGYNGPGPSADLKKSRTYAERAVAIAPNNPHCHLVLARVLGLEDYTSVGNLVIIPDPSRVLEHFARAIELAPESPTFYRSRGQFYQHIGDYPRALADLDRALELKPDDDDSRCSRASVLQALGQYDKALAVFSTYIESRPHDAHVHCGIAGIHMAKGNWQLALDSYTKALEIYPSAWAWYKGRALAHVKLGQHEQALVDLKRALELFPSDTSTVRMKAAVELAGTSDDFRQRVLELADDAVERSDKLDEAHTDRGRLYATLKDYKKAETDFAKAAKLAPQSSHVWYGWGLTCDLPRGMVKEAREKFSRAIEAEPYNWLYWNVRGRANLNLGNLDAADKDFTRVLELHPTHQDALLLRAVAYMRSGRFDEARADMEQAISSLQTAEHGTHYRRALLCLMLGEVAEYANTCGGMVRKFGETRDPMAANFVASTCALAPDAVDDYKPVVASAAKAVEALSDSDQFLNTLGAILFRAGRHDEAIARLTELDRRRETADGDVQSSPAYTWYFLAMAHQKAGNADQAREYLNKANQSTDEALADEENPPAWDRRATLELLRKEAEALLETDVEESAEEDQKPEGEEK